MALEKLSLLIPLGYTNHIIRIAGTGVSPPPDNLFESNVSLEALAVGPSSDYDQFTASFSNGINSDLNQQTFTVGVGAPLIGLIIGADKPVGQSPTTFSAGLRLDPTFPPLDAFFTGFGAKKPELHIHCFFQKPPFIPTTRARDFARLPVIVGLAETQIFRRPFFGRSRLSFFAKIDPAIPSTDPVTITVRGVKFGTAPFFVNTIDLFTGVIPAAGGVLNFNMQNNFFDAVEVVGITTTAPSGQLFAAIEVADAID